VLKVFRSRRASILPDIDEEVAALGAAVSDVPLAAPIDLALLAVDPKDGSFEARHTAFASLRRFGGAQDEAPLAPRVDGSPAGIADAIHGREGTLARGDSLVLVCGASSDEVGRQLRALGGKSPFPVWTDADVRVNATGHRARQKPRVAQCDIGVITVTRT